MLITLCRSVLCCQNDSVFPPSIKQILSERAKLSRTAPLSPFSLSQADKLCIFSLFLFLPCRPQSTAKSISIPGQEHTLQLDCKGEGTAEPGPPGGVSLGRGSKHRPSIISSGTRRVLQPQRNRTETEHL